jgi:tetratricopeptide (TPR) repeat protein
MPGETRCELELFQEASALHRLLFWRLLSDVLLWCGAGADERHWLFSRGTHVAELVRAGALPDELSPAIDKLSALSSAPERASVELIAEACGKVAGWAEGQELKHVALLFAEAAARVEPHSSSRSYTAGRLCRRAGEFERAKGWTRRAIRLARLTRNEIDFANAHRGYGFILAELGRFVEAEPHFWKAVRAALRVGRKSLAGAGYHDLLLVAVHQQRWGDALIFAQQAVALYKVEHPRLPLLAHDVAFFWNRLGYFSSALPVLERALLLVARERERILVLASLARSAAAVRDNLRFQRSAKAVLELAAVDEEMAASSLYHVAEGCRCFGEWARAERLAHDALRIAEARGNATVIGLAGTLLRQLSERLPGDVDTVPDEGGIVDQTREMILRKLLRHPAPAAEAGAVPPERYPTD